MIIIEVITEMLILRFKSIFKNLLLELAIIIIFLFLIFNL